MEQNTLISKPSLEDIVNRFVFRSIVRSSLLVSRIKNLKNLSSLPESEAEYTRLCTAIFRHFNDTRMLRESIDALNAPIEQKHSLKQITETLSPETIIYSMGRTLIEMKGVDTDPKINVCFVRKTRKFWVHPENVETLISMIIPHLPVYVFGDDGTGRISSCISSIYLDTPNFHLYEKRIKREQNSKAIRIRKYGESSFIAYVEIKTHEDGWTGEKSTKKRFLVYTKYLASLLEGEDIWDKISAANSPESYSLYLEALSLIRNLSLVPIVKTVYNRMAFQLPDSSSVRISIDQNLSMWSNTEGKTFPYAILEVKLEEGTDKKWISDLVESNLVIPVDKFSKYLHGCAVHYPNVPSIPYWYNQMCSIEKRNVFFEETPNEHPDFQRINKEISEILYCFRNQNPEDPSVISSMHQNKFPTEEINTYNTNTIEKMNTTAATERLANEIDRIDATVEHVDTEKSMHINERNERENPRRENREYSSLLRPTPVKKTNPPAIPRGPSNKPVIVPVRVEPKVFFANERTFLSWLHFAIFIGGIGAALIGLGDFHAALSGVCFIIVSILFSIYALYLYIWRAKKIRDKNPGPYDDHHGPIVLVAVFLSAMITSVFFKFPVK